MCVDVQGNELIVTSNNRWRFAVYSTQSSGKEVGISEISALSDEEAIGKESRKPLLTHRRTPNERHSGVAFIVKNVIACIEPETQGLISTWCARSGTSLDRLAVRSAIFGFSICALTDMEFVAGTYEGHLCYFSHNLGCNLKETKRTWKAHQSEIFCIKSYRNKMISVSKDGTAQVWDITLKQQLAVLHQNKTLHSVAKSVQYILTCSWVYDRTAPTELRLYKNDDEHQIIKIFRAPCFGELRFLDDRLGVYDDTNSGLVFLDIESEKILAKLKVGCRFLFDFTFLDDGRLVAVGQGAYRGIIATLPRFLRELVVPEPRKRQFCALV